MVWLSMIGIGLEQVKTVLELYEKLTSIINKKAEKKKDIFDGIVSPRLRTSRRYPKSTIIC